MFGCPCARGLLACARLTSVRERLSAYAEFDLRNEEHSARLACANQDGACAKAARIRPSVRETCAEQGKL
jgi:hypothetical protein